MPRPRFDKLSSAKRERILEAAAKAFAAGFYQNLASGREVNRSFAEASATLVAEKGGKSRAFSHLSAEAEPEDVLP